MSKKNNKKYQLKLSVLNFLTLVALSVVMISAKYVFETYGNGLFHAKEFYFESNLLRSDDVEYLLNPTTTKISFTLVNAIDELRVAEDNIDYEITIYENGNNVTNEIFDKENSTIGLTPPNENNSYSVIGSLKNNSESSTTHTISLDGLERGKTYTVVAKGKAGYVKTLEAKFTVSDSDKNLWKHLDVKDDYVLLTVWTENLKGDVSIEFPEGLIPDGTDTELSDVYNYVDNQYKKDEFVDQTNFTNVYSTHIYRFFIDDENSSNLSVNNFIVKKTVSTNPEVIILGETGTPR